MTGKIRAFYLSWKNSIIWLLINYFISYFPSRNIRSLLLRILGAKIGRIAMYAGFEIRNPKGLNISNGCSIGPKVRLDARRVIVIKQNVTIAAESTIWTLHHDHNDVFFKTIGGKVTINEFAWICSRSIILPGVTVGKYSVVASGAVVTKNVPDYAIVGGVPAKIVGYRDKKEYKYTPYNNLHII